MGHKVNDSVKDYPSTEKFRVIDILGYPHPYCITPKHVCYASKHCCGILGKSEIEMAELNGARCGVKGCNLEYSEHESVLLVEIDDEGENPSEVEGLQEYLKSIVDKCEAEGYAGFSFIKKEE